MSGIAGILRFDDVPVARRDLERMAGALRAHGPDRTEVMTAGAVGLAHVLMRMTPEDSFDRQPWRGPSGAVITADLRLDNRDEILARLGTPSQDAMAWSDSRVLLTAWEKLGDDLWRDLRGPFAAAIWDPRRRLLTLARDHLGRNVVMWHRNERFFAFATMPKGLLALPDVPREMNEEKLADFLVLNLRAHETTFYRNVFRIAPAHVATIAPDGSVTHRRYWSARDIAPIRLSSDEAYAEGMRERLDRAVRRQLRSTHPVGCYLSGGLDSSSVAVLAARAMAERGGRLAAFTHVPREGFAGPVPSGWYADEKPYVDAICAAAGNIDVTYLRNDEHDDFADLERVFLALEAPVLNPTNLGWTQAIQRLARERNCRVLLGGFNGNWTISWWGWSRAIDDVLRGRLLTAWRQWRLFYRLSSLSRWSAFRKLLIEPAVPDAIAYWANGRRHGRDAPWSGYAAIRPEFATATGVMARARAARHDFLFRIPSGTHAARVAGLTLVDYAGDWYAADKAIHGVETRDPTMDMDLIEFCLGIPPEQYLAEGVDRSLVRRAMWGLLPEEVLTNRRRGLQAPDWYEKLGARREWLAQEIATLGQSPLARRVIDLDRLERAIRTWPIDGWSEMAVVEEYQLALTRGLSAGRFARWFEAANR